MLKELTSALLSVGYVPRREETLAVASLFTQTSGGGAKGLLLEGPPGCGKTALAEAVSHVFNAPFVYSLLHAWSAEDELFVGVDVPAAVAGDADNVRQEGVLAKTARLSGEVKNGEWVVLCLDEVDKSQERTENLLLDWLQSGRVPLKPGVHAQTVMDRVLVFITSNGQRELSDAFLRRLRRVRMTSLPVDVCVELIHRRAEVQTGIARITWKLMRQAATADSSIVSLQEGVHCAREIYKVAERIEDIRNIVSGWSIRRDVKAIDSLTSRDITALWSEVMRARKEEANAEAGKEREEGSAPAVSSPGLEAGAS